MLRYDYQKKGFTKMKTKTMIILNGSPRPRGNTVAVLKFLIGAAKKQHWQIKQFDLYKMKIKGCAHCNGCGKVLDNAGCVLKDDFTPVLAALEQTQVIVIASPVYCWSVSGCMSTALDRFYSLSKTQCELSLLKNKKVIGVFSSGGDAFDGMDLCVEMLKRLCDFCKMNYVGTLAVTHAVNAHEIAQIKNLTKEAADLINELGE